MPKPDFSAAAGGRGPLGEVAAWVATAVLLFILVRGLLLGRVNTGGSETVREEEPLAYWLLIALVVILAAVSFSFAVLR